MQLCGRLAPSPTGALHLGNARSFLLAWLSIRSRSGLFILRVEDLDHPKVKQGAMAAAVTDLQWLGLDWDEGPDCGGPHQPYIQSERIDFYAAALKSLHEQHLIYPCICSRRDVEEAQSAPHEAGQSMCYRGTCRDRFVSYEDACAALPEGRLPAWRFRVNETETVEFDDRFAGPQRCYVGRDSGDFVIARHAKGAGYMLAVVVDDAAMGVTEVLRGDDLLPTTAWQLLLYRALDLTPPQFIHVPLLVGPDGRRLAKRHGDTRISYFREQGMKPEQLLGFLAYESGLIDQPRPCTANELLRAFSLDRLKTDPLVIDDRVLLSFRNESDSF